MQPRERSWKIVTGDIHFDIYDKVIAERANVLESVDRILFIADVCPTLKIEALRSAAQVLREKTIDCEQYSSTMSRLNDALMAQGKQPDACDHEWIVQTRRSNSEKEQRLDSDLRMYKSNLIKESIRIGHNELAEHYYAWGKREEAIKVFLKSKDFCTASQHIYEMCMNIAKLSVQSKSFAQLYAYLFKAESLPSVQENQSANLIPFKALKALNDGNFKEAAELFISCPFIEPNSICELLTNSEIAVYGTLLALASFDRSELKKLESKFQQFLELDHNIRDILSSFVKFKYSVCLEKLAEIENELLLDQYLHPHVESLISSIRRQALVDYILPYSIVDLTQMASVFKFSVFELEMQLVELNRKGLISGKINAKEQTFEKSASQKRQKMYRKAAEAIDSFVQQQKYIKWRFHLLKNYIRVAADE